jgi:hypothetical protein
MSYFAFGDPPSCISLSERTDAVKKRLVALDGKIPREEANTLMHEWARLLGELEDHADIAEHDWVVEDD